MEARSARILLEALRLNIGVDMTSHVKCKDTSSDSVSMPLVGSGQGRGEASNRDG
jgi:hypothetical protein